jgi:hypothetical protein
MKERARFIASETGGGLSFDEVMRVMDVQYKKIKDLLSYDRVVLWFDACLFDQSMLAHLLTCLAPEWQKLELLCVDRHPGIEPFHGLGQMTPEQLFSVYPNRKAVSQGQIQFAKEVDGMFASGDQQGIKRLAALKTAALPWIPAAAQRWLEEQPDPQSGLGKLQVLSLNVLQRGSYRPAELMKAVSELDTPPQYWGDMTLWKKVNELADFGKVIIDGPADRLPQWSGGLDLNDFRLSLGCS